MLSATGGPGTATTVWVAAEGLLVAALGLPLALDFRGAARRWSDGMFGRLWPWQWLPTRDREPHGPAPTG